MPTWHRADSFVRRRIIGALTLLVALGWPAARTAGAERLPAADRQDDSWPLMFTRVVHRMDLRAHGATVTALPYQRLQHAPNDCALAVVNELQRSAGRIVPSPSWLATSLALAPSGVALDALAATLRELGWPARVTRGAAQLQLHPLLPPAVALVHPGHYVLVTARTPERVEFFDPLVGLVQLPLPAFEARWTGKGVRLSTRDN
jgi:hypothetical protein